MPRNEEPEERHSALIGVTEFDKKYPQDAPGEESGPNARIWRIYGDQADDWNMDMLNSWNSEMDVLLIFAGLFSAVLTAFVIESYKLLQPPPPVDYMKLVYLSITAIANNHSIPGLPEAPPQLEAGAGPIAQLVNVFWFLALFSALTTAFVCILAKQWLAEYLPRQRDADSKRAMGRLQQFRRDSLTTWHIPGIIRGLPVLLHCSLFLYFAGLVLFLWPLSIGIAATILLLAACIFVGYTTCIFLPLRWPNCGFRTPLSRIIFSIIRRLITHSGEKDSDQHNILNAERALIAQNVAEIDAKALDWLASATPLPETYDAILDTVGTLRMAVPVPFYPAPPFRVANYLVGLPLYKTFIARFSKEWAISSSQFDKTAALRTKYSAVFACFVPVLLPPKEWAVITQLALPRRQISLPAENQLAASDTAMFASSLSSRRTIPSADNAYVFMCKLRDNCYSFPKGFKISGRCAQIFADWLLWADHVCISGGQSRSDVLYDCVALLACRRSRAGSESLQLFLHTLKTAISSHQAIDIPLQLETVDPSHFAIEMYSYLLQPTPNQQDHFSSHKWEMLLEILLQVIGKAQPLPPNRYEYNWYSYLVRVLESDRFRGCNYGWHADDILSIIGIIAPLAIVATVDEITQFHLPFIQWCLEIRFTSSQPQDVTTHLVNCLFDYSFSCLERDPLRAIECCISRNSNLFAALTGHPFYVLGKHPIGQWLNIFSDHRIVGGQSLPPWEGHILEANPVTHIAAAISAGLPADEVCHTLRFLDRLMLCKPGCDVWAQAMPSLHGAILGRFGLIPVNGMDDAQQQIWDELEGYERWALKYFARLQESWCMHSRAI